MYFICLQFYHFLSKSIHLQTRINIMNTNNTNNLLQTHRLNGFVAMIIQGVYEFLLSIQFEQNRLWETILVE